MFQGWGAGTAGERRLPVACGKQMTWKNAVKLEFKSLGILISVQAVCLVLGMWAGYAVLSLHPEWQTATGLQSFLTTIGLMVFGWTLPMQGLATYLVLSRLHARFRSQQSESSSQLRRKARHLEETRNAVIFGLAKLAESRDPDTGLHLERIAMFSTVLSRALRRDPRFADRITPEFIKQIGVSSALHDIGKVGVPDGVLLKPDELNDEERAAIEKHTEIGGRCLEYISLRMATSDFLEMSRRITYFHHERWDGTGYPSKLKGEEIPLEARIVAVADVYDALSVERVYKPAFPHEQCVEMIRDEAGKQFDPEIVEVFCKIQRQFAEIAAGYRDQQECAAAAEQRSGLIPDVHPVEKLSPMTHEQEKVLVETCELDFHLAPRFAPASG